MTESAELMIGEFARRCRLPVSTLRYYDRIGLLTPAVVDPVSGYRRYALDQLPTAALVSRLRALGVPPEGITRVLAGGLDAVEELARQRQRITSEIELGRRRLRELDLLLADVPSAGYPVEIVELAAREVAAWPFRLPASELAAGVPRMVARLRSALRRGGHRRAGAWGATFPVEETEEVSGFVFAPLADGRHGELDTAWLPTIRAVATIHPATFARLPLAYHAALTAAGELGTAVGPVIEEYPTLEEPGGSDPLIHVRIPFEGEPE